MTDYNLTVVSDEDDYLRVDYGLTTPVVPLLPLFTAEIVQEDHTPQPVGLNSSNQSLDSIVSLDPPATDMTILAVSEAVRHDREVLLKRFLTLLTEDGGAWSHWYDQLRLVELYQDGNFVLSYHRPEFDSTNDHATVLIYQDYIQYHDYRADAAGTAGIIFFSDHLQSYGKTIMAQQTGLPGTSLEITEKFNIAATIMKTLAIPVT